MKQLELNVRVFWMHESKERVYCIHQSQSRLGSFKKN